MKLTLLLATTLLLSACAAQSNPPQTLNQKLSEATTKEERKETLRLACLNEAEWPASLQKVRTTGRHGIQQRQRLKRSPEVMEMKSLCRQMDDLTSADVEEKLPATHLISACSQIIEAKIQKGQTDHAERIGRICEEMTGKKV